MAVPSDLWRKQHWLEDTLAQWKRDWIAAHEEMLNTQNPQLKKQLQQALQDAEIEVNYYEQKLIKEFPNSELAVRARKIAEENQRMTRYLESIPPSTKEELDLAVKKSMRSIDRGLGIGIKKRRNKTFVRR